MNWKETTPEKAMGALKSREQMETMFCFGAALKARIIVREKSFLMQSNNWGNTQQRWVASGFPFSIFVMASVFATAVLSTIPSVAPILEQFVFFAPQDIARPWTMLLYTLRGTPSIFSLLFQIGLTYLFCTSLERSWGTKAFALFYIFISVISALSISLGAAILGRPMMADPLFAVVGAAVVWGFLNAEEQMSLFFIPMRGIHFAAIAVLYIFFNYAGGAGWSSLPFALLGCVAAFAWLKYGITYKIQNSSDGLLPMSRPVRRTGGRPKLRLVSDSRPRDDRFTLSKLNPLRALKRRQEQRKFEKLMGGDD